MWTRFKAIYQVRNIIGLIADLSACRFHVPYFLVSLQQNALLFLIFLNMEYRIYTQRYRIIYAPRLV